MIHIEKLTKYYDDLCAVDHIDLTVNRGEILGLLGPNGAGKTSTLRMLTGYFLPTSGTIRVKDFSIHQHPKQIKSMMGYLPESAPLYHGMLVYDYLGYVADIRGLGKAEKEDRLRKLATLCGLGHIMHRSIHELSKGLKQRVGLAHAMMSDPEILILDEPTSGLDPNQIIEIREIIRKIGEKKTVILSTHILSEAEATCDRIVIVNKGHIVADGSTQELTSGGSGSQIQIGMLNVQVQEVQAKLKNVAGVKDVVTVAADEPDLTRINVLCEDGGDIRSDLYAAIKETDWILVEMSQEAKNLETIFRELTREN